MCGISGIFSWNKAERDYKQQLSKMVQSQQHRGPDSSGIFVSDNKKCFLGHNRLAILDLSENAVQPMHAERYSIVYNGEIYNFQQLKLELIAYGISSWKTQNSDTEVILNGYEIWGDDLFDKLDGMYAIAIYDRVKHQLVLARDRIGIKPLYYATRDNDLIFASEIKAIHSSGLVKPEFNTKELMNYLSFLTVPAPNTLFNNVMKLTPGTLLRINALGVFDYQNFFDLKDLQMNESDCNLDNIVGDKIHAAVYKRKVSDVPTGVFLSGGIDSSLNAAIFSSSGKDKINTFSIGYGDENSSYKSELPFARLVADKFDTHHFEKILTKNDLLDFLEKMVWHQDEPIADPVCVPVYYVSKLAKDSGVTVCHVGEGADEIFLGYPGWAYHRSLKKFASLPFSRPFKLLALIFLHLIGKKISSPYEWLRRSLLGQSIFWGGAEAFTHHEKLALINSDIVKVDRIKGSYSVIEKIKTDFDVSTWPKSYENWMTFLDLKLRLPDLLLMRVDKMTMATSIEARVPFLDVDLIRSTIQIPAEKRWKKGKLKFWLKNFSRSYLPHEIIERPKQGFGVPLKDWLFTEMNNEIRSVILEFVTETKTLNHAYVLKLLNDNRPRVREKTWYLFNLAAWWKVHIKGVQIAPKF